MRLFRLILLMVLVFLVSCHAPNRATPAAARIMSADSTNAISPRNDLGKKETIFVLQTHLRDTTYVSGSVVLFLRPDEDRSAELDKQAEAAGEESDGDADFGAGISGTEDRLKTNKKCGDIQLLVSTKRYICIKDCKDGPLTIDRDSVNYGYILSGKGRPIAKTYKSVHSGDYIGELDDYFISKRNRPSVTSYSVEFMIETIIGIKCDDFEKQFQGHIDTLVCSATDSLEAIAGFLKRIKYSNSKEGIDVRAKFIYVNSDGGFTEICMDKFRLHIDGRPIEGYPEFHKYLYSMIARKQMHKSW